MASGTVFVGRDRELTELRAALGDVLSGRGRLITLVGEAGIGKTRTAEEFAHEARGKGVDVAWGPCHEGEGAPAYFPWTRILRALVRRTEASTLTADLGPDASILVSLLPELRARLPHLTRDPSLPSVESEQDRFRLFESVTMFLRGSAERRPLLLVLDDLHWADKPSLLLLRFLARELPDAPILVLGTYRHTEIGRRHPLLEVLGELTASRRVQLRGLRDPDVARFIEASTGRVPSGDLVDTICSLTDGNPFFLAEIMALVVEAGDSEGLPAAVPQGIRELIGRRLDRLSEEANRVLTVASAIGTDFDLDVLEHASGSSAEELRDAIAAAAGAGLVSEIHGAPGRCRFAHGLVREFLSEEIPRGQRPEIHRRIGEAFEALRGSDRQLEALAYHFFEGSRSGAAEKAVAFCRRAGERANAQLAYEDAARHFERALEALGFADPSDDALRCDLLLARGWAQGRTGDMRKARPTFLEAAGLARAIGSPEQFARAALGYGAGEEGFAHYGKVDEVLVGLLEEALQLLPATDSRSRARVMGRLAVALYWSSDPERRDALALDAVAMARRTGDPRALVSALGSAYYALWTPDSVEQRLSIADETVSISRGIGDRVRELQAHRWRLFVLLELGNRAAANAEIEAHARLSDELRHPMYLHYTALFRALEAALDGRLSEAEELAQQALALGERANSPFAKALSDAQTWWILRQRGLHSEDPASYGARFDMSAVEIGYERPVFAHPIIWYELGRVEEAREQFDRLSSTPVERFPRDHTWLVVLADFSEATFVLQRGDQARILYPTLLPYERRWVVGGPPPYACMHPMAHYLGLLAATVGDDAAAVTHFEEALRMCASMGARASKVWVQHAYAQVLGRTAKESKAQALLDEARATARELGMRRFFDGTESPKPATPVAATPERLPTHSFRREGEYWTIHFEEQTFRLKDARGLAYIHQLLRSAGREVHVLDLAMPPGEPRANAAEDLRVGGSGDAGEVLDARARAEYRRRLEELADEIEEARRTGDAERVAKFTEEMDALTDQLAAGMGLGGRARRAGSAAERARTAVRGAIASALKTIRRHDEALGRHLSNALKTGTFCSYAPEKPRAWEL